MEIDIPKKSLFGLNWCGWLNVLFAQWFFFRISYTFVCQETEPCERVKFVKQVNLSIIPWVAPLTGWWSDFKYLRNRP